MRLCYVIETSGGGSGQVVLDLLEEALNAGDTVTLIYSPLRAEPSFLTAIESFGDRIKACSMPMHRKVGLFDIVSVWRLRKLLRQLGPFDVIHSHSSKAGALCRLAGLFLPKTTQIYTPHAFVTMDAKVSRVYGWIERFLSLFCRTVIAVSAEEKRHAVEDLNIKASKIRVVPNGIDPFPLPDRDGLRKTLGIDEGAFVVGFVGRLVRQKNPRRLVEAFAIASLKNPLLRLMIVGEGEMKADLEQHIRDRNLTSVVYFIHGARGREVMSAFDAVICSSDYEAFSIVFLEALVSGVPLVSTPVGGTDEAIGHYMTGIVAQDFSSESLAEALLALARFDDRNRLAISNAARHHAQTLALANQARLIREIYAEAMEPENEMVKNEDEVA